MKDEQIIQNIRAGNHNGPIKFLYQEFPKIKSHILASGGSGADARETFHDALILMIEKVSEPTFNLSSKLTTYLYGINRLLWKNKLRKQQKTVELEWTDTLILSNEDVGIDEDQELKIKTMESILTKVGQRCQEILKRFYFSKETMNEIASAMGFSSVNSAKTQKYKCIERAIKLVAETNLQNA